jgi:hypothetical protein
MLVSEEREVFFNKKASKPAQSMTEAEASAYLWCCFFYNCCFCCFAQTCNPVCGNKFCCECAYCCKITCKRQLWLALLHAVCGTIHTAFAIASFTAGAGKSMEVQIFRNKPDWINSGTNGYNFEVNADFPIRIDTVTGLFFTLSAAFHLFWVICKMCVPRMWTFMLRCIDQCICFWRYVEYSISASLMLAAIGMITGLRDGYAMFSVFVLSFVTMSMGLLTEIVSRPLNHDSWNGSYMWRMSPHFFGWVPYIAAWFIVLGNFRRQIDDSPPQVQESIPWFVTYAVYGTALTFTSFAFVQIWVSKMHCVLHLLIILSSTPPNLHYSTNGDHQNTTGKQKFGIAFFHYLLKCVSYIDLIYV